MSGRGRGDTSSRGNSRGGSNRGNSSRGSGGGGSNRGSSRGGKNQSFEKPKREAILDLNKYMNKSVRVKFAGGREVVGILKGFDPLMNIVMDECIEHMRGIFSYNNHDTLMSKDETDSSRLSGKTRQLGLVVCRSTALVVISPEEGSEQIENPFN